MKFSSFETTWLFFLLFPETLAKNPALAPKATDAFN